MVAQTTAEAEPRADSAVSDTARNTTSPADGRPGLGQAITDLVQMLVDYVRQETGDVVHDKLVVPTQTAGQVVAFALAAAGTLMLAIVYLSIAWLMMLAGYVGWTGAFAITGALLAVGAAVFTYLKVRKVQR